MPQRSAGLAGTLDRYATAMKWLAATLFVVAAFLFVRLLPADRLLDALRGWIDDLGVWAPIVYGLIYVAATVALVPGSIITIAAGAIFGLVTGIIVVSLGATTGAALAFLIARYLAREKVARLAASNPKFGAVDRAIGEQGWKIVALLRLSPAIPFNLQNYLYGLTSIRFWPYVLASWLAMLPGGFMYLYVGYLGGASLEAAAEGSTSASVGVWALRFLGLVATVAVTVYVTIVARRAIKRQTDIEEAAEEAESSQGGEPGPQATAKTRGLPWTSLAALLLALAAVAAGAWCYARQDAVRRFLERRLGLPPLVRSTGAYAPRPAGPVFDPSIDGDLARKHVRLRR